MVRKYVGLCSLGPWNRVPLSTSFQFGKSAAFGVISPQAAADEMRIMAAVDSASLRMMDMRRSLFFPVRRRAKKGAG